MLKRLIFCLWILLPFFLFAQNEEAHFTVHDSLTTGKHQGTFIKAMKKFLNFNDFDTTYISPNRYNYALMLDHFTNYEYYSVGTAVPEPQRLRFTPNPRNKIGAYFGWRWIFLGWSVDTDGLLGKKSGKNRGTEFDLSLYSSKFGVDLFYRRTGNDYNHLIVIHCSATKENETFTEIELEKSHRQRGLNGIGYHYYIRRDGNIKSTRPVRKPGAHARGHNLGSIAICYEGGLNQRGVPKDTRTEWQKHSMIVLIRALLTDFPMCHICGHRDLPQIPDDNSLIEPESWLRECPCFDAAREYGYLKKEVVSY